MKIALIGFLTISTFYQSIESAVGLRHSWLFLSFLLGVNYAFLTYNSGLEDKESSKAHSLHYPCILNEQSSEYKTQV